MLAYAAPCPGREGPRPKTLVLIVGGHALALAAVMLARSDLPAKLREPPLIVDPIPIPAEPPKPQPKPVQRRTDPPKSQVTATKPIFKTAPSDHQPEVTTSTGPTDTADGSGTQVQLPPYQPPVDPPLIPHTIVRTGARLSTPDAMLRPPYPDSKRMRGEEATLTLKLTIDPAGRVVAVEPVGAADHAFFESARRHLLRSWRFSPATEDGKPVASTKVITLTFQLGDA